MNSGKSSIATFFTKLFPLIKHVIYSDPLEDSVNAQSLSLRIFKKEALTVGIICKTKCEVVAFVCICVRYENPSCVTTCVGGLLSKEKTILPRPLDRYANKHQARQAG